MASLRVELRNPKHHLHLLCVPLDKGGDVQETDGDLVFTGVLFVPTLFCVECNEALVLGVDHQLVEEEPWRERLAS